MTKHTLTLILGLPGAGKSTYVKHRFPMNPTRPRLVICMDDLRKAYGYVYNEELEDDILALVILMAGRAFKQGYDVVIDESITCLNVAKRLVTLARIRRVKVRMVELRTPTAICFFHRVGYNGFPLGAFEKKRREWKKNREAILALTDTRIVVREPTTDASTKKPNLFRRLFT